MSYVVVLVLVFWIPCIVFASYSGAVAAAWKGRAMAEGFALGLALGIIGWLIEVFLPAGQGYGVATDRVRRGERNAPPRRPARRT